MFALSRFSCLLAEEDVRPLLQRLSPTQRAAVLAALFALVLLGMALVAFIHLGGRFLRRRSRSSTSLRAGSSGSGKASRPPLTSDWDRKQPAEKERTSEEDSD
jgi:hypothetical protein